MKSWSGLKFQHSRVFVPLPGACARDERKAKIFSIVFTVFPFPVPWGVGEGRGKQQGRWHLGRGCSWCRGVPADMVFQGAVLGKEKRKKIQSTLDFRMFFYWNLARFCLRDFNSLMPKGGDRPQKSIANRCSLIFKIFPGSGLCSYVLYSLYCGPPKIDVATVAQRAAGAPKFLASDAGEPFSWLEVTQIA